MGDTGLWARLVRRASSSLNDRSDQVRRRAKSELAHPCRSSGGYKMWLRGHAFLCPSRTKCQRQSHGGGSASASVHRSRKSALPQILISVGARCLSSSRKLARNQSEVVRDTYGRSRRLSPTELLTKAKLVPGPALCVNWLLRVTNAGENSSGSFALSFFSYSTS